MEPTDPRISQFDYALPEDLIARHPPKQRDGGRLLVSKEGRWSQQHIPDLVSYFCDGDVLVVNDTRVLQARIYGRRSTGGRVEILLMNGFDNPVPAMVRPGRRLKAGEVIQLLDRSGAMSEYTACIDDTLDDGQRIVTLSADPMAVMTECGRVALPPYMRREAELADEERYQTVFAASPGAIAAPTASLHLTTAMLALMRSKGVEIVPITLHVGPGTFRNLRSEDLDRGKLHVEQFFVPDETREAIENARLRGARITAVGTTVTRCLESAADGNGGVRSGPGETGLFIQDGFRFQVIHRLLTNFHLPKTSLLMLVSAFGGREHVLAGYRQAIESGYRFYSYGDAMFLESSDSSELTR
jgi:S-adenosylmethionine:tRNA ribosyltransferase-isomerase